MTALGFTPAREQDVFKIEAEEQSSSRRSRIISGAEARKFYENLMNDDKEANAVRKTHNGREQQVRLRNRESSRRWRRRVRAAEMQRVQTDSVVERRVSGESSQSGEATARETSSSERCMELQGLRLLRFAHNGDISGLKELLSRGVDINFQVHYFLLDVISFKVMSAKYYLYLLYMLVFSLPGYFFLDGCDVCKLVRTKSCCEAAAATWSSLGGSG